MRYSKLRSSLHLKAEKQLLLPSSIPRGLCRPEAPALKPYATQPGMRLHMQLLALVQEKQAPYTPTLCKELTSISLRLRCSERSQSAYSSAFLLTPKGYSASHRHPSCLTTGACGLANSCHLLIFNGYYSDRATPSLSKWTGEFLPFILTVNCCHTDRASSPLAHLVK